MYVHVHVHVHTAQGKHIPYQDTTKAESQYKVQYKVLNLNFLYLPVCANYYNIAVNIRTCSNVIFLLIVHSIQKEHRITMPSLITCNIFPYHMTHNKLTPWPTDHCNSIPQAESWNLYNDRYTHTSKRLLSISMLEELTGLLVEVPNLNSSIKTASHLY